MTLKEALEILGIEKYEQRIFNSNSHGELMHIMDYFMLAEALGKTDWFPIWFDDMVKQAEKTWKRPESVFQHTLKLLSSYLKGLKAGLKEL